MSRTLSKSLGTDLPALAQMIRDKGRGRDTVLAHITPQEAALLKRRGGRGSVNPDTGLPEFEDDYSPIIDSSADTGGASEFGGAPAAPVDTAPVTTQTPVDTAPVTTQTPDAPVSSPGEGMPPDVNQTAQAAADATPAGGGAGAGGGGGKPEKNWYDALLDPANLAKLGILGGIGAYAANKGQQSAQQGQAAAAQVQALAPQVLARSDVAQQQYRDLGTNIMAQTKINADELSALGAPQRELGQQLMSQALSGTLTPAGQRSLEALKAQARQNISKRGGVGAMQAGVAEEEATANLLQQQYTTGMGTYGQGAQYESAAIQMNQQALQAANGMQVAAINTGLQQAGIADQYTIAAINLALANDKATAQSLQSLFTNLASVGFGIKSPASATT